MADQTQRPDVPLYNEDDRAHRREIATRVNASLAKDGSVNATGPIPLANIAVADEPDATLWEGAVIYSTDTSEIKLSNGTTWAAVGGGGGGTAGRINTDINTATPPTTEAVTANYEIYDLADDDELATIGYNASNELQIINNMRPATTTTTAMSFQIVGGTDNTLITDKMVLNSNEFLVRQRTGTATYDLLKKDTDELVLHGANSATSTPGTNRILFASRTGGIEAYVGFQGTDVFDVENRIGDALLYLRGRRGVSQREFLEGDPNGGTTLYHADTNAATARTITAATGGFEVNNTSTGSGFERVLTVSDIPEQLKYCTTATTKNTNTTLGDVTGLTGFTLEAGAHYSIEGSLRVISDNTAQYKFAFTFTNTEQASFAQYHQVTTGGGRTARTSVAISTGQQVVATDGSDAVIAVSGYFQANATTGGTMAFQMAQNTSTAVDTTVDVGSWIRITKIS